MANELDRLRKLNDRLQLVPKGTTVDELERNASLFTHAAAMLLHPEGWRRIRKTDGKNVDGMDIDKLVNADNHELRDIVIRAGATDATVGWLDVGELHDVSRFIEVKPDVPQQPPAPPPPPPFEPGDDFFREAMMQLVNERAETNVILDRMVSAIESLEATIAAIGEHFGVKEQ